MSTVSYFLDSIDFKQWNVFVSSSMGIIDGLKMKEPFSVPWASEHGEVIDLSRPRFEPREITLNCFMKASGKADFIVRSQEFLSNFRKPGTRRLLISVHPTKPLVYEVYLRNGVSVEKTWNDELMVGTFQLVLREPEPVKRVLSFTSVVPPEPEEGEDPEEIEESSTVSITVTSPNMVNIYWGDGSKTLDISGTDRIITHEYSDNGTYHIIIAGIIEGISDFETNAEIVWNNL